MNLKKSPWLKNPEREKELKEQKAYLAAMVVKAQVCLNDPKFEEYRLMYLRYEQDMLESIIALNVDDPIQYAFKVRQLVDTLKAYRLLISGIEEDASRKVEQ